MDNSEADQKLSHQPEPCEYVGLDQLEKLGVRYWYFDPETYYSDEKFTELKKERGYSYQDQIEVSPETLDNYEAKLKIFYEEHIHTDEEIRYVLEGSGYFDVRDPLDRWIRIEVRRGDMIVLPAGIYHRFTLDSSDYIKAIRLFVGEPVWTAHPRSALSSDDPIVRDYKQTFSGELVA